MGANDQNNIIERVVDVVSKNYSIALSKEEIGSETDLLTDLGFDSIKVLEIVVYLEEEFEIEFDDESLVIDNLRTIGLIANTVSRLLQKGA